MPDDEKRVTVVFNMKDWARIQRELKRRQKEANHQVTVAEMFRDLVQTFN